MKKTLWTFATTLIVIIGCATAGNVYESEYPAPVRTKDGEFVALRYKFEFDYEPPGVVADSEWSRQILEAMVENMGIVLHSQIGVLLVRLGADYTHDQLVEFSVGRRSKDVLAQRVQERISSDPDLQGVEIYRLDYEVDLY